VALCGRGAKHPEYRPCAEFLTFGQCSGSEVSELSPHFRQMLAGSNVPAMVITGHAPSRRDEMFRRRLRRTLTAAALIPSAALAQSTPDVSGWWFSPLNSYQHKVYQFDRGVYRTGICFTKGWGACAAGPELRTSTPYTQRNDQLIIGDVAEAIFIDRPNPSSPALLIF